jgi:hypothetical protein
MTDQYYTQEVKIMNKRAQKSGLPLLAGTRLSGQAEAHLRGGSSSSQQRPYGMRVAAQSREGPHEAHRRMVDSLQRKQIMESGSHIEGENKNSSLEYAARRPMTQGNDGGNPRRRADNITFLVSTHSELIPNVVFK